MMSRIVTRNIICILTCSYVLSCMYDRVSLSYNMFRRKIDFEKRGGKRMSTNTGENIKTLRKFYGETQEELGSSMNVSGAAISYFENDQRSPDIEMTKNIAQHYGVTIDQLVGSDFAALRNIGEFPSANVDLDVLFKTAYPFVGYPFATSAGCDVSADHAAADRENTDQVTANQIAADLSGRDQATADKASPDNESFINGCKAAAKVVKSINSNLPVMEPVIDHAIRQFETAMEETGMPEAAVNYLLMLIIKWDSLRSEKKRALEQELISAESLKVDAEFMKKNYLGRDRSLSKEESERKEKFIEEYGQIIIEKTRELKENDDWRDFAEYYQALRYLADMVNISENSTEYNLNAGIEQMVSLVLMGNKYAVELVRQPVE